ncbi:MAG: rhodanese-like domain-containing protein [Bacteroidetes bacterium]|nr:rhodanese-like domain-containing protein [Bacteroidota bacterium]
MDLTQNEWQLQLNEATDAVVLDVRTDYEFDEGYILNAINLDLYEAQKFMDKMGSLDKQKSYYIYCKSGSRSSQACALMNQMGFEKTYNLLGGITEWEGPIIQH